MESLNLTPAESLIIISPNSNGIEMIKLTLMDLIIKKALKMNVVEDQLKEQHETVVSKNDSFKLKLKPHEEILMEIIKSNELKLKEYINTIFRLVKPSIYKNEYVLPPLVDKGYFKMQRKMLLALVPYNTYVLTEEGKELRASLIELFDESKYLEKWMREDLGRAKAYLSVVGSHILLLKTHNMEDIKKFCRMLSYIKPEARTRDYYSYYVYALPDKYIDHDDLLYFDFMDINLVDFEIFDIIFNDFNTEDSEGRTGNK
ncbi:MAG: hypothetical protein ACXVH2_03195 [Methanobacterium sp.]